MSPKSNEFRILAQTVKLVLGSLVEAMDEDNVQAQLIKIGKLAQVQHKALQSLGGVDVPARGNRFPQRAGWEEDDFGMSDSLSMETAGSIAIPGLTDPGAGAA